MIRTLHLPSTFFEMSIEHTSFGPYCADIQNALFTLWLKDGRSICEWVPIPEFKTDEHGNREAVFSDDFIITLIPYLLGKLFASSIKHLPTRDELLDNDPFDGEA